MTNIFLFTQNIKLESIEEFRNLNGEANIFLTTHMLFDHEKSYLESLFTNCYFLKFADFLSDEEMEACDENAYLIEKENESEYYNVIKRMKNELIVRKVNDRFENINGYIFSDDLGIDEKVWIDAGFKRLKCDYYYMPPGNAGVTPAQRTNEPKVHKPRYKEVYAAEWEGKKYIFIGNLNRISYRLDIDFQESEYEREKLNREEYYASEECQYLTTIHESYKCKIPDEPKYDIRCMQDGYLPPNYSSYYLRFIPHNYRYYAWDVIGEKTFINQDIPVSLIPFRRKLYMPIPDFHEKIKTVLVAASGSGDWTAQKNRSDDDLMVEAFVEMARRFPDIDFIYRCHHTWTHPRHAGINSINRVAQYFDYTGLSNIHVSSNIFIEDLKRFKFSIPRSSFDEDLKKADLVFGEHSISMIDAALKKIPFASVNLTNRRNFFCGVSDMGFPACETVDDIENVIRNIVRAEFQQKYREAVKQYNLMTDMEDVCSS